jgi:hypothetical protein
MCTGNSPPAVPTPRGAQCAGGCLNVIQRALNVTQEARSVTKEAHAGAGDGTPRRATPPPSPNTSLAMSSRATLVVYLPPHTHTRGPSVSHHSGGAGGEAAPLEVANLNDVSGASPLPTSSSFTSSATALAKSGSASAGTPAAARKAAAERSTYTSPSELLASPSELSASPSELFASPSELLASPSELLASPSELLASPSEL